MSEASDHEVKNVIFQMFVGKEGSRGKHSIAVNENGIMFLADAAEWIAGHFDYAFQVTADDLEKLAERCAAAAVKVRARERHVDLAKFYRMCEAASLNVSYVPNGLRGWDFGNAGWVSSVQEARDLGDNQELLDNGVIVAYARDSDQGPCAVRGAWSEVGWFIGQRDYEIDSAYEEVSRG